MIFSLFGGGLGLSHFCDCKGGDNVLEFCGETYSEV